MSGKEQSGGFDAADEVSYLNQLSIVKVGDLIHDFADDHFVFLFYNVNTSLLL